MSFTTDLIQNENSIVSVPTTRRPSETSYEAWLPQFSGLHKPRGIETLSPFDEFVFKTLSQEGTRFTKWWLKRNHEAIDIFGKSNAGSFGYTHLFSGERKRTFLHPICPPIHILDKNKSKILNVNVVENLHLNSWDNVEMQILSSSGMIGIIRLTTSHGVKTYEVLDSYSQLVFYITPNLAPHQGLQLLILGAERSLLTAAIFQRPDDYSLEIFKPLSPTLKALLTSFTLYVIFTFR